MVDPFAAFDPDPTPAWLRNPDPLGIGLQDRARQTQRRMNPYGLKQQGPLHDPMWDGLFQALAEKGVKNVVGGAVPQSNAFVGISPDQRWSGGGFAQHPSSGIPRATGEAMNIPTGRSSALEGLEYAGRPFQGMGPNTQPGHEEWMASQHMGGQRPPPIQTQRGTTPLNQIMKNSIPNPNKGY